MKFIYYMNAGGYVIQLIDGVFYYIHYTTHEKPLVHKYNAFLFNLRCTNIKKNEEKLRANPCTTLSTTMSSSKTRKIEN